MPSFKFITLSTILAVANAGCVNPTQFANNPVTAPNTGDYPTIGSPYAITWDNTNQGPKVDLLLLSGCPSNCVAAGTIVSGASNTGSYSWTPDSSLAPDESAEGYGIQLVDDSLCEFQYSFHFGLHPAAGPPVNPTTPPHTGPTGSGNGGHGGHGGSSPPASVSPTASTTTCDDDENGTQPTGGSWGNNQGGHGNQGGNGGNGGWSGNSGPAGSASATVAYSTLYVMVSPAPASPSSGSGGSPSYPAGGQGPAPAGGKPSGLAASAQAGSAPPQGGPQGGSPPQGGSHGNMGGNVVSGSGPSNGTKQVSSPVGASIPAGGKVASASNGTYQPVLSQTNGATSWGVSGGSIALAALALLFL